MIFRLYLDIYGSTPLFSNITKKFQGNASVYRKENQNIRLGSLLTHLINLVNLIG